MKTHYFRIGARREDGPLCRERSWYQGTSNPAEVTCKRCLKRLGLTEADAKEGA